MLLRRSLRAISLVYHTHKITTSTRAAVYPIIDPDMITVQRLMDKHAASGDQLQLATVRVGFLGGGRMAQALSSGFIKGGYVKLENVSVSEPYEQTLKFIAAQGFHTTKNNVEVVGRSDVIVVCVKPHVVPAVVKEISPLITKNHLVVSIAAGVTLATLEQLLPEGTRVIRVMPNTPALVGAGVSVYCTGQHCLSGDGHLVSELLSAVGICENLPEHLLDAVTGLSGSGPAYIFMAVEALSDGGVKMGLPRDVAFRLAAQTVRGAGLLMQESGKHPAQLKDEVCSPGGTTICGVHSLESNGFRTSLISAVEAATLRSKELGATNKS